LLLVEVKIFHWYCIEKKWRNILMQIYPLKNNFQRIKLCSKGQYGAAAKIYREKNENSIVFCEKYAKNLSMENGLSPLRRWKKRIRTLRKSPNFPQKEEKTIPKLLAFAKNSRVHKLEKYREIHFDRLRPRDRMHV
jgi:hypothetical protein